MQRTLEKVHWDKNNIFIFSTPRVPFPGCEEKYNYYVILSNNQTIYPRHSFPNRMFGLPKRRYLALSKMLK